MTYLQEQYRHIRKILLMCWVILCMPFLQAQTSDKQISIQVKDATLEEFTTLLREKSGYSFMYGQEVVLSKPVTLEATNQSLWEILKLAFTSQPVSYEVKGKHIILRKQEPAAPPKKRGNIRLAAM